MILCDKRKQKKTYGVVKEWFVVRNPDRNIHRIRLEVVLKVGTLLNYIPALIHDVTTYVIITVRGVAGVRSTPEWWYGF